MIKWNSPGLKFKSTVLKEEDGKLKVISCVGELSQRIVEIKLPFENLPCTGYRNVIVQYAKADRLYVKGSGFLQSLSIIHNGPTAQSPERTQ